MFLIHLIHIFRDMPLWSFRSECAFTVAGRLSRSEVQGCRSLHGLVFAGQAVAGCVAHRQEPRDNADREKAEIWNPLSQAILPRTLLMSMFLMTPFLYFPALTHSHANFCICAALFHTRVSGVQVRMPFFLKRGERCEEIWPVLIPVKFNL